MIMNKTEIVNDTITLLNPINRIWFLRFMVMVLPGGEVLLRSGSG